MAFDHSNRVGLLKAAGITLLGVLTLAGMSRPLSVHSGLNTRPDAAMPIPERVCKVANLTTMCSLIMNTPDVYALLESGGPWTLLAPDDQAWARLTNLQQNKLNDPTIRTNVLEFHIIPGFYPDRNVQTGMYPTVLGPRVRIIKEGNEFFANHALWERHVSASDGVIHIQNKVLMRGFRSS